MPGFSWDISAKMCNVGSKLRLVPGSPCHGCYALKGHFTFPKVREAHAFRLNAYNTDPDWVLLMTIRLLLLADKHSYFRWFASGDLQSRQMLSDINQVCHNTIGYVQHWLPTQERAIVSSFQGYLAPNLNVRISSTKVGETQRTMIRDVTTSSIAKEEVDATCPSFKQQNTCGACRACWDKTTSHIVYLKH